MVHLRQTPQCMRAGSQWPDVGSDKIGLTSERAPPISGFHDRIPVDLTAYADIPVNTLHIYVCIIY